MQENYPILIAQKNLNGDFKRFSKIMITSDEFTIGRSLGHSVVIPYLAISRKHCTFRKINDVDWALEDSSSFGIQVNNKRLKKGSARKLSENDTIQLDATGDFIYKFTMPDDSGCTPRKRIKLERDLDVPDEGETSDIIHNVQLKFEESQNFEIRNIEERIQTAKQMQTTSKILKQQLELDMNRKMQKLQDNFALQIENLKGEKNEVERQKTSLEEERDMQLAFVKGEMESKITELMERIHKHNETESELLNENSSLKEKLLKEREDFLAELHRENSSKQDLMKQLETKIREQEEIRLKEREDLEKILKAETENLKLAKEKELKELEEQKQLREQELQTELEEIRSQMREQANQTEIEKIRLQQELKEKSEQMIKLSEEERSKIEQLMQDRAEAEKRLIEAQAISEKSEKELSARVCARETELAALASARIQQQAEQSTEVIISLQEQLENVRSQLQSVETEKNTLLESICHASGEGSSTKEATLAEVGELMESELQCSICAELFVAALTLNCSHTYCTYCITVWTKKKRECPICRAPITTQSKSLVLDSFIEKMVANLTDEMKNKRQAMLRDREAEVTSMMTPTTPCPRRTTSTSTRRQRGRRPTTSSTTTRTTATTRAGAATAGPQIVDLTRLAPMAAPAPTPLPPPVIYLSDANGVYRIIPTTASHQTAATAAAVAATSRGSPASTTAVTDAASAAARAAIGRQAAPTDSARQSRGAIGHQARTASQSEAPAHDGYQSSAVVRGPLSQASQPAPSGSGN